jgi:hypothetical protein
MAKPDSSAQPKAKRFLTQYEQQERIIELLEAMLNAIVGEEQYAQKLLGKRKD